MRTTFRSLLESREKFIGTYIMFPADTLIEVMKLAGFDFLIFDIEHEQLTFSEIMPMLRTCDACGMATMIRVPGLDECAIKKALDMGASAIKIPGISTAMEAKQAVSLCKYPPEGIRGACPFVRGTNYGIDRTGCWEKANREVVVSLIIEGPEGVSNLEEIIKVPGVDCISVGNFDLSVALGVPGQVNHPLVHEAVVKAAKKCEEYGISCSVQVVDPNDAKKYKDLKGVSHYHTDLPQAIIYNACKLLCDGLRKNSR